jgi:high affinity Mn2+ porin
MRESQGRRTGRGRRRTITGQRGFAPRAGRGWAVRMAAAAWLAGLGFAAAWPLQAVQAPGTPGAPQTPAAQTAPATSAVPAGPGPGGAEPAAAEKPEELTTVFPHPGGRLWVAGQANLIFQGNLPFHSPYSGPNSLQAKAERRLSRVLTFYTGLQLGGGAELLIDAESASGSGISDALGLAGFTNLDVVRNPQLGGAPYLARALYHQTFALGPERVANDRRPVSSAAEVAVRRFDFWIGKLGTVDFFDLNGPGSDSHLQFLNWTVDDNGAFDYAADTRGYSYGVVGELHERRYSLRAGVMTMPKVANGIDLDLRLDRARGQNLEAEVRPAIHGRQGVVRLLAYRNVADMGSYREAIDAFLAGRDPLPDITKYRRQGRTKTGYGLDFEQEVTGAVRVFGRWGINDGHTESFAYTEAGGTIELGADLRLRNEKHKLGVALVDNRLSNLNRTYLALGGLGFLLGDGRLNYGHEHIVEAYYNYRIWRGVNVAADLQYIRNPGYNRDRGPVWVPGTRLHVDF